MILSKIEVIIVRTVYADSADKKVVVEIWTNSRPVREIYTENGRAAVSTLTRYRLVVALVVFGVCLATSFPEALAQQSNDPQAPGSDLKNKSSNDTAPSALPS